MPWALSDPRLGCRRRIVSLRNTRRDMWWQGRNSKRPFLPACLDSFEKPSKSRADRQLGAPRQGAVGNNRFKRQHLPLGRPHTSRSPPFETHLLMPPTCLCFPVWGPQHHFMRCPRVPPFCDCLLVRHRPRVNLINQPAANTLPAGRLPVSREH